MAKIKSGAKKAADRKNPNPEQKQDQQRLGDAIQSNDNKKPPINQKNFFIWITFAFAIFGGFPGVISIFNFFNDSPQFKVNRRMIFTLNLPNRLIQNSDPQYHSCLLFVGTIINKGSSALFPQSYQASIIDSEGNETMLEPVLLHVNFQSLSPEASGEIEKNGSYDDLQRIQKIPAKDAHEGCLLFYCTLSGSEVIQKGHTLKITCFDKLGEAYVQNVPFGPLVIKQLL